MAVNGGDCLVLRVGVIYMSFGGNCVGKLVGDEARRIHRYLLAAFRRVWGWSVARAEAKKAVACAKCGVAFKIEYVERTSRKTGRKYKRARTTAEVDHIEPVIPITGFVDWQVHYARTFEGELMPLCKDCHKEKTLKENAERRKAA